MKLVFVLSLLSSACPLQLDLKPATVVPVGEFLSILCRASESDSSVWALHFSFRNASNSLEILRRLDGTLAILLDADGYPARIEKSKSYRGGLEIEVQDRSLRLKMRVNTATNGSEVTCKELLFGDKEGDHRTRRIVVSRRPSAVLMLVQPDSSRKKAAEVITALALTELQLECRADLGSSPVPWNHLFLQIGSSRLPISKTQCKEGEEPSLIRCQWKISVTDSRNGSSVACVVENEEKKEAYRSEETKLFVNESVSLMLRVAISICGRDCFLGRMTILTKARPQVKDVIAALVEQVSRKYMYFPWFSDCNKNWHIGRYMGHYKKTGEVVTWLKDRDGENVFFNLNGSFMTRKWKNFRYETFQKLSPNESFFYVKDFANVVWFVGED